MPPLPPPGLLGPSDDGPVEAGWELRRELPSRARAEVRGGRGWMANAAVGSAGTKPPPNCREREVGPEGPASSLALFRDLQRENTEKKTTFENIRKVFCRALEQENVGMSNLLFSVFFFCSCGFLVETSSHLSGFSCI